MGTGERGWGAAWKHFYKYLIPVYQLLVLKSVSKISQILMRLDLSKSCADQSDQEEKRFCDPQQEHNFSVISSCC